MQTWIAALTVLALLTPQGAPAAEPEPEAPAWQTAAELVREVSGPEEARQVALALLDWAETGETVSPQEVRDLADTWRDDPVETAWAYAAVLDAAEEWMDGGGAPADREDYLTAARAFSPLFTRLMERETTPWREESPANPTDLADFEGIWYDGTLGELLIFRGETCRVVIPFLDCYGERAYDARLRSRSAAGYCPALEVDFHDSGSFQGPLAYYVSGLAADHFWCNTQGQRFDRLTPGM